MHHDDDKIKTKYIQRLEDTLVASQFRCVKDMDIGDTTRLLRRLGGIRGKILQNKRAELDDDILSVISVSVKDEVNGLECAGGGDGKTIEQNIEQIIDRIEKYAKEGTSADSSAGSGTLPLYHQFVNPIDQ